jgi:hypothetical protein
VRHILASTLSIALAFVLSGCGSGAAYQPSSVPQPLFFDTTGNWQFATTSTAGMKPLSVAGSFGQSLSEVTAEVHVDGSDCFDPRTTVGLSGKLAGSKISFSSTSINGQVITLVGDVNGTSFSGTFTIEGGCAGGDQGTVTGVKMASVTSHLNATFTTSGKEVFTATAQLTQGSARSDGSYGITGTAAFGPSCFKSGTISSATFPSGSFILGASVALRIETDNGTISFQGTANQATGEIAGNYVVSDGTCSQTGTAVFVATGQWDY